MAPQQQNLNKHSLAQAMLYTFLWASAAIATKVGLQAAPPLILACSRFTLAGLILIGVQGLFRRPIVPPRRWWGPLILLGLLNTTLYLGSSFLALKVVPAGLFNLYVTINPLVVFLLEYWWLKRSVAPKKWWGLGLATGGLIFGAWQSMASLHTPLWGIGLILFGQLAMAVGSLYFHACRVPLSGILINTWQLLIGAALLWPIAFMTESHSMLVWNWAWWGSLLWLVGGVSIGAMLLWFNLLRRGAGHASMWLVLTPVIGYILGFLLLHEPVSWQDGVAGVLVMAGLTLANGHVPRGIFRRPRATQ